MEEKPVTSFDQINIDFLEPCGDIKVGLMAFSESETNTNSGVECYVKDEYMLPPPPPPSVGAGDSNSSSGESKGKKRGQNKHRPIFKQDNKAGPDTNYSEMTTNIFCHIQDAKFGNGMQFYFTAIYCSAKDKSLLLCCRVFNGNPSC